jgi:hypothetical protein
MNAIIFIIIEMDLGALDALANDSRCNEALTNVPFMAAQRRVLESCDLPPPVSRKTNLIAKWRRDGKELALGHRYGSYIGRSSNRLPLSSRWQEASSRRPMWRAAGAREDYNENLKVIGWYSSS